MDGSRLKKKKKETDLGRTKKKKKNSNKSKYYLEHVSYINFLLLILDSCGYAEEQWKVGKAKRWPSKAHFVR